MYSYHFELPVLQRAKSKLILRNLNNQEHYRQAGTFHDFNIVHPVTDDNKTIFMYLFIPKNDAEGCFSFKPILNKDGKTVSIVYELGTNADYELAAMALLYLLTTTLCECHPPAFEILSLNEILDRFENVTPYVPERNEWEWDWN